MRQTGVLFGCYLNKEPSRHQRQTTVLSIESVVVSIEGKVIQIEEPTTTQYTTTLQYVFRY